MTILTVRHVTTYRYRRPIAFGDHRMMFRPRDSYDQRLIELAPAHHAGAGAHPLDPRPVRQLRRAGAVQDAGVGTAVREHDSRRPLPRQRAGFPHRAAGADLSLRLRFRGDARPDGVDRARISRPDRRDRPLGAQVPAAGAPDADRTAADDAHLRHQGRLHLYAAQRARHAGPGRDGAQRTRQLPRLRAADDGGGALARARRPIRVRLSLRAVTRWAARGRGLCRRRLDPRLVPGLSAGRRLGGVRSHQRHHRQPRSHPRRGRARSQPGGAALRHLCRQPGRRARDEGAGQRRSRNAARGCGRGAAARCHSGTPRSGGPGIDNRPKA